MNRISSTLLTVVGISIVLARLCFAGEGDEDRFSCELESFVLQEIKDSTLEYRNIARMRLPTNEEEYDTTTGIVQKWRTTQGENIYVKYFIYDSTHEAIIWASFHVNDVAAVFKKKNIASFGGVDRLWVTEDSINSAVLFVKGNLVVLISGTQASRDDFSQLWEIARLVSDKINAVTKKEKKKSP